MIVGGLAASIWMSWQSAWVAGTFHLGLAMISVPVGLLTGAYFGMIAGVLLGWLKRSVLTMLRKHHQPVSQVEGRSETPGSMSLDHASLTDLDCQSRP